MLHTLSARRGAVTAPHHLAAQSGLAVLREGGNAIEAAVAAAATVAVVYPHMNGIGGDGFWIIGEAGRAPTAIDACGRAGAGVDDALFDGLDRVPSNGPLAACTVAGTISGWMTALEVSRGWGGKMTVRRLLEDAIHYAEEGFPVSPQLAEATGRNVEDLGDLPGYAQTFLDGGAGLAAGHLLRNPDLARILERLVAAGLDDFYRGEAARAVADGLAAAGVPLTLDDLGEQSATAVDPLALALGGATVHAMPPPTQGVAALMILGLFERLGVPEAEGFDHVHGLVECIKQAYAVRNAEVADPDAMTMQPAAMLADDHLDGLAARIDRRRAGAWPHPAADADTIWLGVIDGEGRAVSFIQSLFGEFGSGIVLPGTGILWQNRGSGFSLEAGHPNQVRPRHKPYHTLCPAMATFTDGRRMSFGTRGADGQPQTLSAFFSRYALFGQSLQQAVTAPRWRLGMGGGATLGIENRFDEAVIEALRGAGHDVLLTDPFDSIMGHAGALVVHPSGVIEAASDPRSDGVVAAF